MGTLETGLPEAFINRMKAMLGEDYEAFIGSYEKGRAYGFRRNPLKSTADNFEMQMPFSISKVLWAEEGYFCVKEEEPGKHVLHEAGAYYIQEPSAMAVAEYLNVVPGERICDLCAAPGGKTTQIAGKMQGEGLLVSNEIIPSRARILSQNIERMGVRNCVVLNENTDQLADQFPLFFHGILVDAPCSGEGMFRKNDQACAEWSQEQVTACADRQLQILENADRMLMPGGRLVYSTCTFAPEENEGVLARFLRKHPEYELCELPIVEGMDHGHPEWVAEFGGVTEFVISENDTMHLERSVRLWPHRLAGEGHFVAKLQKHGEPLIEIENESELSYDTVKYKGGKTDTVANEIKRQKHNQKNARGIKSGGSLEQEAKKAWEEFSKQVLCHVPDGRLTVFGEHMYLLPKQMRALEGLKIERAGLEIGELKKNRFEPAHALALALMPEDVVQHYNMTKEEADRFIRGEAIMCEKLQGWVLMCYQGYSVGWAKASGNMAKNHYPKGLRIQG